MLKGLRSGGMPPWVRVLPSTIPSIITKSDRSFSQLLLSLAAYG